MHEREMVSIYNLDRFGLVNNGRWKQALAPRDDTRRGSTE